MSIQQEQTQLEISWHFSCSTICPLGDIILLIVRRATLKEFPHIAFKRWKLVLLQQTSFHQENKIVLNFNTF